MAMDADHAGTVEFSYHYPQAAEVFLVGSFNGWNPQSNPMRRSGGGRWTCAVELAAGAYQFYYLARLPIRRGVAVSNVTLSTWSSSSLDFVVVTPRGGSVQTSQDDAFPSVLSGNPGDANLLPLNELESALIRGFRRLPDHESRSAFLDVLEESVYS
jgi:hypothetical protein